MYKVLVVSMISGPGSRKSTMTASVFAKLKWKNYNCEYVGEYAKDKVWEESIKVLDNQIYVFGKQHHRIWRLAQKVDIVLTDSPLLLSIIYDQEKRPELENLVISEFKKYDNLCIFLNRKAIYNPAGRIQNEEESKQKDQEILDLLNKHNIPFIRVNGDEDSVDLIVEKILDRFVSKFQFDEKGNVVSMQ